MSIEDGGSAFPCGDQYARDPGNGMSLRDWFAGQAMQGELSSYPAAWSERISVHHIAARAFEIADAMLLARQGKEALCTNVKKSEDADAG